MSGGKQVGFFMTRKDEESFVSFAMSTGDIWLVRDHWYEDPRYEAYSDREGFFKQPVLSERNETSMWQLWNKSLCGDDLIWDSFTLKKPPHQRLYTIRHDVNYMVEFTRCFIKDDVMEQGRLAYLGRYEDADGIWKRKDERLTKWYERLARWIRKNSVRTSWDGENLAWSLFILPGALEFYQQGGKLGRIGGKPGAFQPLKKDVPD